MIPTAHNFYIYPKTKENKTIVELVLFSFLNYTPNKDKLFTLENQKM